MSGSRYIELANSLTKNKVYINYCQKMVLSELLDFITQYISAPMPAKINQDLFDGIKEDKREALWRLAFNYIDKEKDFTRIEDYFLEKRDVYYLTELMYVEEENHDIEKIVKKIKFTNDEKFINDCFKRLEALDITSDNN